MSTQPNGYNEQDISRGRRNPNSAAAFERGKAHHALDRERILEMVHNSFMGITSAEIEQRTGVPKNCFSGRLSQLAAEGLIEQCGRRDNCGVWVPVEKQRRLL